MQVRLCGQMGALHGREMAPFGVLREEFWGELAAPKGAKWLIWQEPALGAALQGKALVDSVTDIVRS